MQELAVLSLDVAFEFFMPDGKAREDVADRHGGAHGSGDDAS